MIQTSPLTIEDFAGGITDNYIDAAPNKAKVLDNFLITYNKKLITRPGSEIYDETYYQIPPGAQRIGTLINFNNDSALLQQSAKNIYTINAGWTTLQGPSSNPVFSAGSTSSVVSHGQWNEHLFVTNSDYAAVTKIYRDSGGVWKVRTAGLPVMAAPTVTAGAAGANSYIYAFHYFYEYQSSNKTFQDFGPVVEVELTNSAAPDVNPVAISVIPVISNGATGNYDTSNIKVYIYRSINGGTTLYKIGEVTNGTTTFNDNFADSAIQDNLVLYTDGGVVSNDPPPACRFLHITNQVAYYAYIQEGSEILSNRMRQSIIGDLDSVPEDFYVDIDQPITGLSSYQGIPILIGKKGVYRVDGVFDDLGRGGMVAQKIDDTASCVSQGSMVQIPEGVVWCGDDGVYYTDGYRVLKINIGLDTTYGAMVATQTQKNRVQGTYDPIERRVFWCVQRDSASTDNDSWFVLDLRWGLKPDSVFTTASGGTSFAPTALVFFNKELLRADTRGYVFKHTMDNASDLKINTGAAPSTWQKNTIIWDYTSITSSFGTTFVRKWIPRIVLTATNQSNVSIQIRSINDDNRKVKDLSEIRFRGNITWGDANVVWGDESIIWNFDGIIEEQRRFPAGSLRCSYKSIQITNAFTIVTNSDSLGTAVIDGVTNKATLSDYDGMDPNTVTWPEDVLDYYISFEDDGYERLYQVTARTDATIDFADAFNAAPTGVYKWVLKGYPKDEVLNLLSYTLHYALLSKTQDMYHGATGGNA